MSMSVYPNNNEAVANLNSFRVIGKGAHARLIEMIATKIVLVVTFHKEGF